MRLPGDEAVPAQHFVYSDTRMPLREKALIARIRQNAVQGRNVVTGIGDDSAVLAIPQGHQALVTTDFSLEGVHFRRQWHPPDSVGHKCLARGLSDIAAMGGTPIAAFLSLALPRELPQKWVDGFMLGFLRLADEYGVSLAGGDTAESPAGVLVDIIVLGSVLEGIPAIVLFGPLMFPIARQVGVHEVHYAMVVILAMGIGLFAPPFGVGYYAACAISRIHPDEGIKPIVGYVIALIVGLAIVIAIPWVSIGFL